MEKPSPYPGRSSLDASWGMTGQPELRYAEVEPDEHALLFELYSSTLPNAERIRALYEWRLSDIKASGGIRTIAARSGSRIVGAISVVPLDLGLGGSCNSGAWHIDTVVAASHRGRGIARKLVHISAEGLPLVAAKGSQPVMYALRKSMGFSDVPNSTYLLCALSPVSLGGSLRKRLAVLLFYLISRFRRRASRASPLRTHTIARFEPDFDLLCERILEGGEATPAKSSRYLNWRYTQCPDRSYLIVRAEDADGQLRGAAVIRPNSRPYLDAWLVDMIVEVDDQQAQHALLDACFRELHRTKASCVRTFATSPTIRRALGGRGFRDTGVTPRFTYRAARPLDNLETAAWNVWHGDSDIELVD
jgi:GNAT superfamily N-acetyltransferase